MLINTVICSRLCYDKGELPTSEHAPPRSLTGRLSAPPQGAPAVSRGQLPWAQSLPRWIQTASYEGKWIKLVPKGPQHPVTQSSIEHTFMHELVHMCLYHTEQSKLNDNEDFVDMLAGLLHQALTTQEFE